MIKKRWGIFFFSLLFILNIITLGNASATTNQGYIIKNIDLSISVNENNSYTITEIIDVFFNEPRRGIIRNLSDDFDGKAISINNFNVKDESNNPINYTRSSKDNIQSFKIGDENVSLTGDKRYVISYDYIIGKDRNSDFDLFFHNIVGTNWNTTIENINFRISMPKDFDTTGTNIQLFSGVKDSTSNEKANYSIDGKVIYGSSTAPLNAGEGITIKVLLPNKYFITATTVSSFPGFKEIGPYFNSNDVLTQTLIYLFLAILSFISGFLIYIFLKKLKANKNNTINSNNIYLYPPKDLSPVEIAFIYNKKICQRDLMTYLYYWANKGYITLDLSKKYLVFNTNSIKGKHYEKYFFNKIYKLAKKTSNSHDGTLYKMPLSSLNNLEQSVIRATIFDIIKDIKHKNKHYENRDEKNVLQFIKASKLLFIAMTFIMFIQLKHNIFITIIATSALTIFLSLYVKILKGATEPKNILTNLSNFFTPIIVLTIILFIGFVLYGVFGDDYSLTELFSSLLSLFVSFWGFILSYINLLKDSMLLLFNNFKIILPLGFILFTFINLLSYIYLSVNKYNFTLSTYDEISKFRKTIANFDKNQMSNQTLIDPNYINTLLPYAVVFGYFKTFFNKVDKSGYMFDDSIYSDYKNNFHNSDWLNSFNNTEFYQNVFNSTSNNHNRDKDYYHSSYSSSNSSYDSSSSSDYSSSSSYDSSDSCGDGSGDDGGSDW